jgi:hypothetical protein
VTVFQTRMGVARPSCLYKAQQFFLLFKVFVEIGLSGPGTFAHPRSESKSRK